MVVTKPVTILLKVLVFVVGVDEVEEIADTEGKSAAEIDSMLLPIRLPLIALQAKSIGC